MMNKMNVRVVFSLIILASICYGCQNGSRAKKAQTTQTVNEAVESMDKVEVSFVIADRYFVKNTYNKSGVKKITTQDQFDSIFGMAATMGENGLPTMIDFNKHIVIAVIEKESNLNTQIKINSLTRDENQILVDYSIENKGENSYTTKPALILILDITYQDYNVEVLRR